MLNREGSLCNKESLPSPVQLFVANLIRSQGLPELTLSVLSLDSGFRICSFALTRGRRDGRFMRLVLIHKHNHAVSPLVVL